MVGNLVSGILISSFAVSAPLAVAVFDVAPLFAGTSSGTIVVERAEWIGNAFSPLPQMSFDPATAQTPTLASKGDLPRAPAPDDRSITIGYQVGANITVLARVPGAKVARRWSVGTRPQNDWR